MTIHARRKWRRYRRDLAISFAFIAAMLVGYVIVRAVIFIGGL